MTDQDGRYRLGVMGGTFDPIHHGHLVCASEAASKFALDEVVFVPTGRPRFKEGTPVSPAEDRYLMTVIATAGDPRFTVSRIDMDRDGITYTIDTLRELKVARGDGVDLFFITGADALMEILTWRAADELFALAHFIGATRPGYVMSDADFPPGAVSMVEVPALAISSSECRNRTENRAPIRYLVPDGVAQYIDKRGLYAHAATALAGTGGAGA